jgi:site-specific recombinase XerD
VLYTSGNSCGIYPAKSIDGIAPALWREEESAQAQRTITIGRCIASLTGLNAEELIHDNPFTHLKPPKTENRVIQALTSNEIERLLSTCAANNAFDIRNRAMLSIFLDSGLRVSKLASLTLQDVDLYSGSILVRHGKGKKQRVVHIGSKAQKALWKYVTIYR